MNNQLPLCLSHWFVYDTPNGTFSEGCCLYCGKKDKALNVMPQELKAHNKISTQHLKPNNAGFYLQGGTAYLKRIRDMEAVFYIDKDQYLYQIIKGEGEGLTIG